MNGGGGIRHGGMLIGTPMGMSIGKGMDGDDYANADERNGGCL